MSFEALLIDENRPPDIVDESGAPAVTYVGFALPGTVDTSEAKFKIKKITAVAGITKTMWANGNRNYNNIWDNRAAIPYSYLT
jgi:hypothetical protein